MSVNTAHANGGVLIHAGETILLFSDNVQMEFVGQDAAMFKGTKQGRIYLTTHRVIFNTKNPKDQLLSFSSPFITMSDVELEQPVFGANYIKGKIRAQENGGYTGETKFKMTFKAGGCIDFAQALLRAAKMAQRNSNGMAPPPYTAPAGGSWYEVPPPAYTPNPGQYGWLPTNSSYFGQPTDGVYVHDAPPPYPGINVPGSNPSTGPQGYPNQPAPSYPGNQPAPSYPGTEPAPSYPGNQPNQPHPGFGFNAGPSNGGAGGFSYPTLPQQPFGFTSPSAPTTKEQEAAASAFFDPRNPNAAYVQQQQYQPPRANDNPPPYSESLNDLESQIVSNANKKTQ